MYVWCLTFSLDFRLIIHFYGGFIFRATTEHVTQVSTFYCANRPTTLADHNQQVF